MTAISLTPDIVRANAENLIFITFHENARFSSTFSDLKVGEPQNQEFRVPFSFILTIHELTYIFPQATYSIEWEGIGSFDIFLVPVGHSASGVQYQAVFG